MTSQLKPKTEFLSDKAKERVLENLRLYHEHRHGKIGWSVDTRMAGALYAMLRQAHMICFPENDSRFANTNVHLNNMTAEKYATSLESIRREDSSSLAPVRLARTIREVLYYASDLVICTTGNLLSVGSCAAHYIGEDAMIQAMEDYYAREGEDRLTVHVSGWDRYDCFHEVSFRSRGIQVTSYPFARTPLLDPRITVSFAGTCIRKELGREGFMEISTINPNRNLNPIMSEELSALVRPAIEEVSNKARVAVGWLGDFGIEENEAIDFLEKINK